MSLVAIRSRVISSGALRRVAAPVARSALRAGAGRTLPPPASRIALSRPFSIAPQADFDQGRREKTLGQGVAAQDDDQSGPREKPSVHFKASAGEHPLGIMKVREVDNEATWDHPYGPSVWSKKELDSVKINHYPANDWVSKLAYTTAQTMRHGFDLLAGFKTREPDEAMYINRIIFLETVAGVPGMVAAVLRHLNSLRNMKRDHGWIHTLLEEAENERMHLLTFIHMKQPGPLFRAAVLLAQGAFFNVLFFSYLMSPRFCHRLVGYIEEEAVKTYTGILEKIDAGKLPDLEHQPVPRIAIDYWRMPEDASFRDLILVVRADEANHRHVNHTFASIDPEDYNPFIASKKVLEESTEVPAKQIEGGRH